MRFILGLFALLFIRPILYHTERAVVCTGVLFYDPRGKMILGTVRWMTS